MKNNSLHITYDKDAQMLKTAERLRCTSGGGALRILSKKNKEVIKKAIFTDRHGNSTVLKVAIFLLMFLSMEIMAQDYRSFRDEPTDAIYLAYQPWDHGLGLRYDHHFNWWAGVYGSASYGKWGLYQMSGLGEHMKLTAGILIPYKDYAGGQFDWSLGLNYHKVWGEVVESEVFKDDPQFHNPWSFEIGLTCKLKRFAIGCRTDILRWEPCIDVGIPIHYRKQYKPKKRKR